MQCHHAHIPHRGLLDHAGVPPVADEMAQLSLRRGLAVQDNFLIGFGALSARRQIELGIDLRQMRQHLGATYRGGPPVCLLVHCLPFFPDSKKEAAGFHQANRCIYTNAG